VRKIVVAFFVFSGILILAGSAAAQDSGSQDSTGQNIPPLRARRDAYIIVPYPSPARHGVTMNIQFYNQNSGQYSLRIVDINDKTVKELQPSAMLDNGIHSYPLQTNNLTTGTYFIRLTTYTTNGNQSLVQDQRFIILH
jgi:hypothetical protein